ncbi:LytTR family DNA-binding domain-containing protein [Levilactobacillus parabrevis]|uniref:LytTR family DNA-binding domain-containing protein n=1 Tax=Levilactobacillus parabrevis TaxID=357278 RepID=UPI0021A8CE5F|nr:LytTR family DNA-binding domain-containing protein [Levilactobacillus parabrevis]MCT4487250.1 LytTR family transcriptional regulator [Levilactobacillus parabrevis]MCT4490988.1 LytTR family transcriptional regulator [Levilactobacillus parabrevis]
MRIHVEVDPELSDSEVTIRVPARTAAVDQLVAAIHAADTTQQLTFSWHGENYRVNLTDILFFEASDHQVAVHTATAMYTTGQRLYELAADLPPQFMRISKSAILNRTQVFSLTRSVTGNLVKFQNSHKQLYVSRRYYQALKRALEEKG